MKAIYFKQATKLDNGNGSTLPLHYWSDNKQCVSCFKPTWKERLTILFKGQIWIGIKTKTPPPMFISGESVFR
jgi:hypothetical protein